MYHCKYLLFSLTIIIVVLFWEALFEKAKHSPITVVQNWLGCNRLPSFVILVCQAFPDVVYSLWKYSLYWNRYKDTHIYIVLILNHGNISVKWQITSANQIGQMQVKLSLEIIYLIFKRVTLDTLSSASDRQYELLCAALRKEKSLF